MESVNYNSSISASFMDLRGSLDPWKKDWAFCLYSAGKPRDILLATAEVKSSVKISRTDIINLLRQISSCQLEIRQLVMLWGVGRRFLWLHFWDWPLSLLFV